MNIYDAFDGATAQEIIDLAKILPDEFMAVKKILVQTALKKASHHHDQLAYMVRIMRDEVILVMCKAEN